ncbi:glutathione synthase [Heterostelium album PN500]|uniref:Glutathione synthetase n=1 Tax=Heterostelium pallidum (strain ATCC 26659 / Pp 5 / PN500) TaxID=670386 RepID=D3BK79_HETP5|nr:glutathione synthase [Heterostelium album PN500]EFA78309.1 glutathione synthase [Heterostelium album PN500]|eukprot:XP_020430434.1 glutathione synthase [Heterostelium album PN500]
MLSNKINQTTIKEIAKQAIDWSFGHSLIFEKKKTDQENEVVPYPIVTHIPISLLPNRFPKKLYGTANSLAKDYNELVHQLSRNYNYIQDTLKNVQDSFTQSLLEIHRAVNKEGLRQSVELGIFRSDYMLHQATDNEEDWKLYQVELNTISSSFGCISTKVSEMHKFLIEFYGLQSQYPLASLPENHADVEFCKAFAKAFELYGKQDAVVMIIVQPDERNIWDQKMIGYTLWQNHKIRMIRRTLQDINERATLHPETGALLIAGYTPNDYPSQKEWDARLLVERSLSIKCPSIANHLVGAKKIQQAIAKTGILEQLYQPSDSSAIGRMRDSFTGLYSLSKEDIDRSVVERAIQHPELFVMKPQREGGGNNIYGENVRTSLQTMSPDDLSSYILMDRIVPKTFSSYIIRERELHEIEALYELGIFGLYVGNGDRIEYNENGGILLRTKTSTSDEGGVAAGFAFEYSDSTIIISIFLNLKSESQHLVQMVSSNSLILV